MKTEEELRKLFYNYTNANIEISYSETEPVMDVDAFIKLMTELNLCNKHIVSGSLPVDKSTKHGWPIQYYKCPHCECKYTIRLADNNCAECGTALTW